MLITAAPAAAHPLGNFSVNHLSTVSISSDRVEVRYVLDQAEIPTVQERGLGRAEVLRPQARRGRARTCPHGRRPPCGTASRSDDPRLSFPTGAGGLPTTRLEVTLAAAVRNPQRVGAPRRHLPRPDRLEGDRRGARRSAPPCERRRRAGIRRAASARYPKDLLQSPLDQRDASFSVTPGNGSLVAPKGMGGHPVDDSASRAPTGSPPCSRTRRRAAACSCSCCSAHSGGEPCTRCRPGTARRWSRRTSSGREAARATRSSSARRSR